MQDHIFCPTAHRVAVGILFTAALLASIAGCHRPPSPDVVATVNGKDILRSDLEKYYKNSLGDAPQAPSTEQANTVRLNVLGRLIDDEIAQQNAAKLSLSASDEDVNAKVIEVKARYTQEEFDKYLHEMGISLDDYKKGIRRNLTRAKLMNREIDSKINVSDADIAAYYNSHKSQFNYIEPMYHLARIVTSASPAQQTANLQGSKAISDADARKKIEALHAKLVNGEDFGSLALTYSEDPSSTNGGDMGFVTESALHAYPELFSAISKLNVDQNTGIIPIVESAGPSHRTSYVICRLLGKEVAGQRALNDPNVQQKIRQQLREAKGQLLQAAYLEKVRDEAKIHNYFADEILRQGAQ